MIPLLTAAGAPEDVFAGGDQETVPGDLTAALTQADGDPELVGGAEQSNQEVDLEATRLLGPGDQTTTPAPGPAPAPSSTATGPSGAVSGSAGSGNPGTVASSPAVPTPASSEPARTALTLPTRLSCRNLAGASTVCHLRVRSSVGGHARASIGRGDQVLARFTVDLERGAHEISFRPSHRISSGVYRLVMSISRASGRSVTRREVRVTEVARLR